MMWPRNIGSLVAQLLRASLADTMNKPFRVPTSSTVCEVDMFETLLPGGASLNNVVEP
jgi:hypothetical protein